MFRRKYNAQAKAKEELGAFGYGLQPKTNSLQQWTAQRGFVDETGQTHLHQGVNKYSLQASLFEAALDVGCDVNAVDNTGATALHIACKKGLTSCVEKLVKHRAKTDLLDADQMSPLIYACRHGHHAVVRSLIKHGTNVNQSNSRGELALHYSCSHAHEECTELLLKHKAKPNYPDNDGSTPLIAASRTGNVLTVHMLLTAGARPDKVDNLGRSPLHWAALTGNTCVAEVLIKEGASLDGADKQIVTAFMYSIFCNHSGILRLLVDAGCDRTSIDGLNGTALTLASLKGHRACVKVLLSAGEDPDEFSFFGMTALTASVYESHHDVTKDILECDANVNKTSRLGFTALFSAICHINDSNAVMRHRLLVLLLQYGADVNHRIQGRNAFNVANNGINNAMSFAVTTGYTSLVKILLQAGNDTSIEELQDTLMKDATFAIHDISAVLSPIMEYKRNPINLRNLSRLAIRKKLGNCPHRKLDKLPIPNELKAYINFSDLYDIVPERPVARSGMQDLLLNMIDVKACGLTTLEGSFLFQRVKEPVLRATPPGPCQCSTCIRIAAIQTTSSVTQLAE